MMSWTAIVPLKPSALGKSRLSGVMSPERRAALREAMLQHVMRMLHAAPNVTKTILLCRAPPPVWSGAWIADEERGLNAELAHAAETISGPLLVIHADLPLLEADDIAALIDGACPGTAIAPDRHGTGTNALALADPREARFAFGAGSFAAHRSLYPIATVVARPGLACDLDTPADLAALSGPTLDPAIRDALATLSA